VVQKHKILENYEPENRESLNGVYCEVLKNMAALSSVDTIMKQFENVHLESYTKQKARAKQFALKFKDLMIDECY
jgi:hypothetical protein